MLKKIGLVARRSISIWMEDGLDGVRVEQKQLSPPMEGGHWEDVSHEGKQYKLIDRRYPKS